MKNIRNKTNEIRSEYKELSFKNILEDIENSIEEFGIKVLYSDMSTFDFPDSISGYSRINEIGVPEIVVNVRHSSGRRRFTMAHELGHILLHWGWPQLNPNKEYSILYRNEYSGDANNQMENEANEFAAQLLIPLDILEKVLPNPITSYTSDDMEILAGKVAKAFKVSKSFAWRQLDKLKREEVGA
ncbi:TPA: ImmA/IrrE family metallo-endopeptidase [Staphylococcus pseudintermedius]|nr:ImmA/IrrE family metallo-endopeptidase [Staphylococcus pseudintermedius]ELK4156516.1 ImmA/IrrE family metallo-endopeptidase [Staphylococcus pseudintermedius]MDK3920166.1 ImmA/IrrE family metallo-endopeptidase [Staphylococcus pseudintermedius]HAR6524720.1 ImmA/IrrE family metallo-endopeptidase [Staphylococcus pseudintermedius]